VLENSPVPAILGMDFLVFAKMKLDFVNGCYMFAFRPSSRYDFESMDLSMGCYNLFPCSEKALTDLVAYTSSICPSAARQFDQLVQDFPKLFPTN
jgi:hypothetical protein